MNKPKGEVVFRTETNVVVNALAGTGKTTTIKNAVERLFWNPFKTGFVPSEEQTVIIDAIREAKSGGRIHMTSFSTDAADQLAVGLPEGVTSGSTYGMGLGWCKRAGMAGRIDRKDWKYGRILSEFMSSGNWEESSRWKGNRLNILELCKKARLELHRQMTWSQIEDLAEHYGIEIPYSGRELATEALNFLLMQGLKHLDEFDYVDMVWVPCMLGLVEKTFDHLFVDEYQDMGKAQQEICYRSARRLVAIGDPNQAIYGFIGADANATQSFCNVLGRRSQGVKELPLTYTRRCPKTVVAEANKIVPTLKALPEAPDGDVQYVDCDSFDPKKILTPRDMLICPTNAPLILLMFQLQKLGIKAYIRKSDIVDQMLSYVNRYEDRGIEELRKALEKQLDSCSNSTSKSARIVRDKYTCLREIADKCLFVADVAKSINRMFADNMPGAIRLSTVHRSKGLEARKVVFWEYNNCGAYARLPWERIQGKNLLYVGITRSMQSLVMARGNR